jgi:YHS domain-containing protein
VQDPTLFLNQLGVTATSILDESLSAIVDSTHCIVLNYETFLFASDDERSRFKTDPTKFCGPLTDPVTLQRFIPIATSPHLDHNNRTYYFWSDSTQSVFAMMPDMYASPHYKMRPKPDSTSDSAR